MPYVAEKPRLTPSTNELRSRIPGWGVDLDPSNRPAVPKEKFNPQGTGAHWDFPECQPARWRRERSPEHKFLTPVFGTSCPPRGLSGAIRRYAYRYSEGRAAHWLMLLAADRVDVLESRIGALLRGRPDSRIIETGVLSEFKRNGLQSRLGQHRADVRHQWIDVVYFVAPYVALAGIAFMINRRVTRRRDRTQAG